MPPKFEKLGSGAVGGKDSLPPQKENKDSKKSKLSEIFKKKNKKK